MAVFTNVKPMPSIAPPIAPNLTALPHGNTVAIYPAASMSTHAAMVTQGPGLAPFWQHGQMHGPSGSGIWSLGRMPGSGFGHQH
jgi:hypothetical protein